MTRVIDSQNKEKTVSLGPRRGPKSTAGSKGKSSHRSRSGESGRRGSGLKRPVQSGGIGANLDPKLRAIISESVERSTFIVFDIETTGGNPERNGITEICALKIKDGCARATASERRK